MPLIDRSYFIGELNIPGSDRTPVGEELDWFIAKYEPEFLRRLLGLNLYNAFISGLQESVIAGKWTNLLSGAAYTANGVNKLWRGLISQPAAVVNALEAINTIEVVVGRGHLVSNGDAADDPVAGASSVAIPPGLVGKNFILVQRAFGQLRSDEWSIVGNTLQLNNWTFSNGDTYFFKSATLTINTSAGLNKESLIANYVYYWYMRNKVSQTTPGGEVGTANENAVNTTPAFKLWRATAECQRWAEEMREFLNANTTTYTDWEVANRCLPVSANAFGI